MDMYETFLCSTCGNRFHAHEMHAPNICQYCQGSFRDIIMKAQQTADKEAQNNIDTEEILTPSEVVEYLDKYVIGQEQVKRAVATTLVNHMYTVSNNFDYKNIYIRPSVLMITGPTGSGKTLTISHAAELFDIPFISVDCTSLTAAGYVGESVEEIFTDIVEDTLKDPNFDGNMIVYLDEIDKIAAAKEERGKDVNGKAVQQALLKMIEGDFIKVSVGAGQRQSHVRFCTGNVLFILSGAFTDVREFLDKKAGDMPMGYTAKPTKAHYKITAKDLMDAGMIKELIGRVTHIVEAKELTKKELRAILTEPEDAILKQLNRLAELRGLEPIDVNLDSIVNKAIQRKVGARGLRQILSEETMEHFYGKQPKKKTKK